MDIDDSRTRNSGLRQRAAAHLGAGRPADGQAFNPSQALAVLYQLASSPATAPQALSLLHELQVHQVELDLQNEELAASRNALEAALAHQTFLFEHAPVGYLLIDSATVTREVNRAALRLLGVSQLALQGQAFDRLLDAPSRERLQAMLARARDGLPAQTQTLRLRHDDAGPRVVQATADRDMTQTGFLLALMAPPATAVPAADGGGKPMPR